MAVRGKTQHPANSLRRFAEHHAFLASVICLLRVKTVSSKDFKAVKCILPQRTALCGEILCAWHHALRRSFLLTHVFLPITYHHCIEGIKPDSQVQNFEDWCVVALRVAARAAFHRYANFWPSCLVLIHRPNQEAQHLQISLGDQ
jgi:hypothetical protein